MSTHIFEEEFAGPADYARLYRNLSLQVIPSKLPSEDKAWKRPVLAWREYEEKLTSDETFAKWYGAGGQYSSRSNLGLITGTASDNVLVVDVDLQRPNGAQEWLMQQQEACSDGIAFRTPTQRTGGGGIQMLFRGRNGWQAPTCKTGIGVDIRGQGGFAVLPPSIHETGQRYEWLPNLAPWQVRIMDLPFALEIEIERLAAVESKSSGSYSTGGGIQTASPAQALTPFGQIVDGREDYMTRLVWARMLDIYRDCPVIPSTAEISTHIEECFQNYERKVKSRINDPSQSNASLLEQEGRGISLMISKFQHAMHQWDNKIAQEASKPHPHRQMGGGTPAVTGSSTRFDRATGEILEDEFASIGAAFTLNQHADVYETLDIKQIRALPDPIAIVEGLIYDQALGIIVGPPGCGKTFIAQSLALAIANKHKQWFDRAIHKSGPVLYISSEGVGGAKARIKAWEIATTTDASEAPFHLLRQTLNFMSEEDVAKLIRTVHSFKAKVGADPVAIVVDTLSRVLAGAEENDASSMTLAIRACDMVREAFECCVILVHHTNKTGSMRGSSVFEGAADFILQVEREKGQETGQMQAIKIKDAEDGWTQSFMLAKIPLGDLKGSQSLYACPSTTPVRQDSEWPDRTICQSILSAVEAAWAAKEPWSPYPQAKAVGRHAASNIAHRWGLEDAQAARMVELWLANKILSYDMCDPKSKLKGLRVTDQAELAEKAEKRRRSNPETGGRRSGGEADDEFD